MFPYRQLLGVELIEGDSHFTIISENPKTVVIKHLDKVSLTVMSKELFLENKVGVCSVYVSDETDDMISLKEFIQTL